MSKGLDEAVLKALNTKRSAHELVSLDIIGEELCDSIAFRIAKSSAEGIEIDNVKLRYCTIAQELYCLQPKQLPPAWSKGEKRKFLRKMAAGDDGATVAYLTRIMAQYRAYSPEWWFRRFFATKTKQRRLVGFIFIRIRRYLSAVLRCEPLPPTVDSSGKCIPRRVLSTRAMRALAEEWLRDPDGLRNFLLAILEHWRKIGHPRSTLRRKAVINQIAETAGHNTYVIQERLQKIGIFPVVDMAKTDDSQRTLIKQHLSRDLRSARAKRSRVQ
jgi:hypothetical protein